MNTPALREALHVPVPLTPAARTEGPHHLGNQSVDPDRLVIRACLLSLALLPFLL